MGKLRRKFLPSPSELLLRHVNFFLLLMYIPHKYRNQTVHNAYYIYTVYYTAFKSLVSHSNYSHNVALSIISSKVLP